MRVTYDFGGNGHVVAAIPYPPPPLVDFPDLAALPASVVATNPSRFTVVGAPGARQLLDTGVTVASEIVEVAPGGGGSASPGQALVFSVVLGGN